MKDDNMYIPCHTYIILYTFLYSKAFYLARYSVFNIYRLWSSV